ncbi:alpha/beta fold hydrolase [Friedmanniella luteola]|uniref:alpha/beta fold hydrolase n=1 Tax=Friedmanniella luteola TaxID=546871 RepID=UPI0018D35FD7|nr:hypothetical protein [Friedmanniella luteola]
MLLHGHPRTSATWHRVAPRLVEAGFTDRAAGRTVDCPLLLLWSSRDDLVRLVGDPLAVWRPWATDLRGHGLDCGHHVAEEAPAVLTAALLDFLRPGPVG